MNRSTFINGAVIGAVLITGISYMLNLDKKSALITAFVGGISLIVLDKIVPDKK